MIPPVQHSFLLLASRKPEQFINSILSFTQDVMNYTLSSTTAGKVIKANSDAIYEANKQVVNNYSLFPVVEWWNAYINNLSIDTKKEDE